ncbi:WD40 repeat-like protein [Suillus decipiens]|nr:WD40 repeat-like protein [Suillus decipiens]
MAPQLTPVSPPKAVTVLDSQEQTTYEYRITQRTQLSQTRHSSNSVVVLLDQQRMVTSLDQTIYLSNYVTKKVLKRMEGHFSDVSGLAVSRDRRFIASCDTTGGIIPWHGETGVCLINSERGAGFAKTNLTPQNGSAAAAQNRSTIQINEAHQFIRVYDSTAGQVHISLDFSADGESLAVAGDRTVKFWHTKSWKENEDARIPLDAVVHCVRYSSAGNYLATATEKDICIYSIADRQRASRIKTLEGNIGGTFTLTWTLQGTHLLSGGGRRDPTIRVWDVSKGEKIEVFHGHTDKINAISVNDSSNIITSSSCDGSFHLWPFPYTNTLEVSAGAFLPTFFSGGNYQEVSHWVLPAGLVSTKTEVKVIEKTWSLTVNMDVTARTILCTTGGELSTAVKKFTEQINTDSSNYAYFVHRSIVYARTRQWKSALEDADKSISIQESLIGYMSKGIAHYGLRETQKASNAFHDASRFGDSASHLLPLVKAIAIFNTAAEPHESAIKRVNDMANNSFGVDLLVCKVVLVYFYAEMAFAASKANTREKAIDCIDTAIKIADNLSLKTMDFSRYTEFVVIFGWDFQSLWLNVKKYKCLILIRTCNIESLEYYRLLMEECDEAQRDSLRLWFARESFQSCRSYCRPQLSFTQNSRV